MANICVRPARETDLEFIVWAMMTAARSHLPHTAWERMFGRDAAWTEELLRCVAVSAEPHWCHMNRFRIAEIDGEAAGAMSSFDPATEGNAALAAALLPTAMELGITSEELPGVLARSEVIEDATPKAFPESWGAENVAVVPGRRGQGVIERLFDTGLDEGRAAGRSYGQILCLNGNERGLSAWRRNGFELRGDYRSRACDEIYGSPGLKLLVRPL